MIKNEFIDGIHAVYKVIAIKPRTEWKKNSGLNLSFFYCDEVENMF